MCGTGRTFASDRINASLIDNGVGAGDAAEVFVARDAVFGVGTQWLEFGAGDVCIGACGSRGVKMVLARSQDLINGCRRCRSLCSALLELLRPEETGAGEGRANARDGTYEDMMASRLFRIWNWGGCWVKQDF